MKTPEVTSEKIEKYKMQTERALATALRAMPLLEPTAELLEDMEIIRHMLVTARTFSPSQTDRAARHHVLDLMAQSGFSETETRESLKHAEDVANATGMSVSEVIAQAAVRTEQKMRDKGLDPDAMKLELLTAVRAGDRSAIDALRKKINEVLGENT